jgi:hypothetical protein
MDPCIGGHLVALLLAVLDGQAEAPARNPPAGHAHAGVIVDATTGKPLPRVTATAYGSTKRVDAGLCPTYDQQIMTVRSASGGAFALRIPQDKPSYLVTYCSPTFVAFTQDANDNMSDGTLINPRPVRLFPRNSEPPQMSSAIRRVRDAAREQTIALHRADIKGFVAAMHQLKRPEDRVLVAQWTNSALERSAPEASPLPGLAEVVEDFAVALEYFRDANPPQFEAAVKQFAEVRSFAAARSMPEPEPEPLPPPKPKPVPDRPLPVMDDFDIQLTNLRKDSTVDGPRLLVTGRVTLRPDGAGPAGARLIRPAVDALKTRGLELVVLVRPVAQGDWWVQPMVLISRDGTFSELVYLGEADLGIGQSFQIIATIATRNEMREGTKLVQLPEKRSRSDTYNLIRAR